MNSSATAIRTYAGSPETLNVGKTIQQNAVTGEGKTHEGIATASARRWMKASWFSSMNLRNWGFAADIVGWMTLVDRYERGSFQGLNDDDVSRCIDESRECPLRNEISKERKQENSITNDQMGVSDLSELSSEIVKSVLSALYMLSNAPRHQSYHKARGISDIYHAFRVA